VDLEIYKKETKVSDPLVVIALGAAIGGAAGKFVEKAWDSGEKWIKEYFKDHKETAQKNAENNSISFLNELAARVKYIEDTKTIPIEKISSAQDHPDFSAMLQKALLTSAQTEEKEKHILLARLVSERLISEPETVFSLASKMACDAISYITTNQLRVLGFCANLYTIRPTPNPPTSITIDMYQDWFSNWFIKRLNPYRQLEIGKQDINHLESLSCIRFNILAKELNEVFVNGEYKFDIQKIYDEEVKQLINKKFTEENINSVDLTTTGMIIGVMVSDMLSSGRTSFKDWE
jgi:hypothetical protein